MEPSHTIARSLRSDNNAGLCPEALAALTELCGHAVGYGDDPDTPRAIAALTALFGPDIEVFFVATGTAANTLSIAALTEPWQRVLCSAHSHYADDESTAPERITLCRTAALTPAHDPGKLTPRDIEAATAGGRHDVHEPAPGVVTITNATELGTVYTPDEVRALCQIAHARGYRVHVDGARFANAVAELTERTGESAAAICRALTVDAGVAALSFGGTKNGLAFGEAVIFFCADERVRRAAARFPYLRKSTGHLVSKHRMITAPFARALEGGAWLRHAGHANAMAARLADGLARLGLAPAVPREANGVFVALPAQVDAGLRARGHGYYPFGSPMGQVARFMCSFDTRVEDIDALLDDARALVGG